MKARGKRLLAAAGIVGGVALAAALIFSWMLFRGPLRVGLVGLDGTQEKAVLKTLAAAGVRAEARSVPGGSLEAELRRFPSPDLVFFQAGAESAKSLEKFVPLPRELSGRVPPSVVWAADEAPAARVLPIAVDHFELAWTFERFGALKLEPPVGKAALIRAWAALRGGGKPVVVMAGGEDEALLLALSEALLARRGAAAYKDAVAQLRRGVPAAELLAPGTGLRSAADELDAWRKAGLLSKDWTEYRSEDLRSFMESKLAPMVLQTLSFHRTVPYQTIATYASAPFPRLEAAAQPALLAPVSAAAVPGRSLRREAALRALWALSAPEAGRTLAEASGRAAAVAAARAPDLQAADALAWAAGSRSVVNGLYRDGFARPAAAADFAKEVRDYLRRAARSE